MLRNCIGKILYGWSKREFYGQVRFTPSPPKSKFAIETYGAASRVGEWLFRLLGISYCSTIVQAARKAPT
jgi:hypothetical protein